MRNETHDRRSSERARRARSAWLAAALLGLAPALAAQEPPAADAPETLLRLKSGEIAFGQVLAHDPDGIRFRMLESGGEIPLPWSVLDPTQADELRLAYGYVSADADEPMVDADRVTLANGAELVGRIVQRSETHLWVKRAEGTVPVPLAQVRGAITSVQTPALDIFTREELYQQKVTELAARLVAEGRAGAQAHDELARYCERLFDYAHALEHYKRAAERDPTYESARLAQDVARAESKAVLQQQVDALGEIDLQRARKRYDKALELLTQFRTLYPKSPLLTDLAKLQDRVGKSQERDLRTEVVERWHFWSVRLAREAARKTTFEEVRGYLDEKMGEELAQKVRDDVQTILPGIAPDQVRRVWSERKGGKFRTATYGLGTWLLGESARAELDQAKDKDKEKKDQPAPGSQSEARQKLEERIKRYLENQKLTRDAGKKEGSADDPQVFWASWNWAGRSQWVLAYFAEKSGEFHDVQARFSNCRECGGTGARDVLFTGNAGNASNQQTGSGNSTGQSGETLVACPACHTIGVVRRIRYR